MYTLQDSFVYVFFCRDENKDFLRKMLTTYDNYGYAAWGQAAKRAVNSVAELS